MDWKDPLSVRALNDQVKCILLELYYSVNIYQLLYEIPQTLEDVYGILFLVTWKLLFVMCLCFSVEFNMEWERFDMSECCVYM